MSNLEKMSGEQNFNQAPSLPLNMIKFNGKKGRFSLVKLTSPKVKKEGRDVYEEVDLGEKVEVIFLKIRRQLKEKMEKNPQPGDPKLMSTTEHNSKGDEVLLYKYKGVEVVDTANIVSKYPMLRTNQVVYAIWNNEIVRIVFKGSALGSESKSKEVHIFYSYISSFVTNPEARDGVKDHFYDYTTILKAIEERGELGEYGTIDFQRGEYLLDEQMPVVEEKMTTVFEYTQSLDKYYREKIMQAKRGKKLDDEQEKKFNELAGGSEYPDEDINPEDIPF